MPPSHLAAVRLWCPSTMMSPFLLRLLASLPAAGSLKRPCILPGGVEPMRPRDLRLPWRCVAESSYVVPSITSFVTAVVIAIRPQPLLLGGRGCWQPLTAEALPLASEPGGIRLLYPIIAALHRAVKFARALTWCGTPFDPCELVLSACSQEPSMPAFAVRASCFSWRLTHMRFGGMLQRARHPRSPGRMNVEREPGVVTTGSCAGSPCALR